MADRTSATLFADIFQVLASGEPIDRKAFALELWKQSQHYDFHPYQMYCDDALLSLGLARRGVDPNYPDDMMILYRGDEGFDG